MGVVDRQRHGPLVRDRLERRRQRSRYVRAVARLPCRHHVCQLSRDACQGRQRVGGCRDKPRRFAEGAQQQSQGAPWRVVIALDRPRQGHDGPVELELGDTFAQQPGAPHARRARDQHDLRRAALRRRQRSEHGFVHAPPADQRRPALEDVFWAVMSSREFMFNH